MKLLLDQNLSHKLCEPLAVCFPGTTHVKHEQLDTVDDIEVRQFALTNGFTVVTLDADFNDLATLLGVPPKVIWLRWGNRPTFYHTARLIEWAESIIAFEDSDKSVLELY